MEINRYKYSCTGSLELYDNEVSSEVLVDMNKAKKEIIKLHLYYIQTGSYDVSDIYDNTFELVDYESNEEYIVKLEVEKE